MIDDRESAKLRGTRALVPYVPCTLRGLVHHTPRALRAPVPHVPRAFRTLMLELPRDLSALVSYVPRALRALVLRTLRVLVPHVSYVMLYLTCLVPCVFSCCSCFMPHVFFFSSSLTGFRCFKLNIIICI